MQNGFLILVLGWKTLILNTYKYLNITMIVSLVAPQYFILCSACRHSISTAVTKWRMSWMHNIKKFIFRWIIEQNTINYEHYKWIISINTYYVKFTYHPLIIVSLLFTNLIQVPHNTFFTPVLNINSSSPKLFSWY